MKKIIAGMLASAALAGVANAATTVTQTYTYTGSTDFATSLSFDLFDSSLGTLTGVTISDSYGFTTQITAKNNGGTAAGTGVSTSSNLNFTGGSAAGTAVATALNSNSVYDNNIFDNRNVAAGGTSSTQGTGLLQAGQQVTLAQVSFAPVTQTQTLSSNLAAFIGTGTALLNYGTFTQTNSTNSGGNFGITQATTGTGTFSIFYTYTAAAAVPEPATWAMMIAGFGLVGYGMRRRGTSVVFN